VDEAFLDLSSESQIQIQVRHRGLDILVPQAVFDLSGGVSPGEHVDRTRMSKAVHGIDVLKALGRQGQVSFDVICSSLRDFILMP
jgi:hypothetical protein